MQSRNVFLALGAATLAAAQTTTLPYNATDLVDTIPACGLSCLSEAASLYGCNSTDRACQCNHHAEIQDAAELCLQTNCTHTESTTTGQATLQICEAFFINEYPACSAKCIAQAAQDAGCDGSDSFCLCREGFSFTEDTAYCLANACNPEEFTAADSITDSLCTLYDAASVDATSLAANTTGAGQGGQGGGVHSNATTTGYQVVDSFTTWCPEPTVVTYDDQEYTVTEATLLTVTNCPCTIKTTGAAHATGNATISTHWSNATTTAGPKKATKATTASGPTETGPASEDKKTSPESGSTGKSGSAGKSGAAGAAGSGKSPSGGSGESAGSGSPGTKVGSSEPAEVTYVQSGAAANYASIQIGLVAVFASIFVMGC